MAEGPWIPAFDSIWTHPKTKRLGEELKLDQERAAAKFLKLCAWLRDRVESGDLAEVDAAGAAAALGLRAGGGVSMAQQGATLMAALKASGLVTNDARAHVVGWEDGPGRLVQSRREDRLRKAHGRGQHGAGIVAGCPRCEDSGKAQSTLRAPSGEGHSPLRKGQAETVSGGQRPNGSSVSTGQEAKPRTNEPIRFPLSTGQDAKPGTVSGVENKTDITRQVPPSPRTRDADASGATNGEASTKADLLIATAKEPWAAILEGIRAATSSGTLATWYAKTWLEVRDQVHVVRVPNQFALEWLRSKYAPLTREHIIKVTGRADASVRFELEGGPREPDVIDPLEDERAAGGGG